MRILHISHTDMLGGAGRAAYRLHTALRQHNIDSWMLVQHKISDDSNVIAAATSSEKLWARLQPKVDKVPSRIFANSKIIWSNNWLPNFGVVDVVHRLQPDIVHLHWIGGYVALSEIVRLKTPLFWSLHDMWAATGGCHYDAGCERYTVGCGQCPLLPRINTTKDLSYYNLLQKGKVFNGIKNRLTVIALSAWMAQVATASVAMRNCNVVCLPNCIDTNIYKPIKQSIARNILNLPAEKPILLFGAMNSTSDLRKGFEKLSSVLKIVAQKFPDVLLMVFGASESKETLDVALPIRYLGQFNDDVSLALLYSASDIFLAPSLQDNLPNTVMESLACGCPTVAFNIGGMPDLIEHRSNGYLAAPFDVADFAQGIADILSRKEQYQTNARGESRNTFAAERVAPRYIQLYQERLSLLNKFL